MCGCILPGIGQNLASAIGPFLLSCQPANCGGQGGQSWWVMEASANCAEKHTTPDRLAFDLLAKVGQTLAAQPRTWEVPSSGVRRTAMKLAGRSADSNIPRERPNNLSNRSGIYQTKVTASRRTEVGYSPAPTECPPPAGEYIIPVGAFGGWCHNTSCQRGCAITVHTYTPLGRYVLYLLVVPSVQQCCLYL